MVVQHQKQIFRDILIYIFRRLLSFSLHKGVENTDM